MGAAIMGRLDGLLDHYVVACIFLAQFILTLTGVGDVRTAGILGLLLCLAGFAQTSARADVWVLVPLIGYNVVSMLSSFASYGNITDGYGSLQSLFPVVYLLLACLSSSERLTLKRLCAAWTGVVALCGTVGFVWGAVVRHQAGRLGGLVGNPNAMGIFLVIGWFALLSCRSEEDGKWDALLRCLEPLLLFALALTLSMGSFVSMAVGMLALLAERPRRERFPYIFVLLAKAALGIGTGLLLYLAATRTDVPWICLPLALYGAAVTVLWGKYERFLRTFPKMAFLLTAMGAAVAATAVVIRPSSVATFSERLEMMSSAARYLTANPLLGVGPYRWRLLDLQDGGTYFNTWHVHNALLHVGVELGWLAPAMLAAVIVRFYRKRSAMGTKAGTTAFFFHNLMDTSFFYTGITTLVLILAHEPGGKKLSGPVIKVIFGAFAAVFAWNLHYFL